MSALRIATRASELALTQARWVARLVEQRLGLATELVALKTSGDLARGPLAAAGGKGLFVKEIEEALLEGRADLAVHSAKDLPAETPDGLALVAFPAREDPRDALVSRERGAGLEDLRPGARVGTGSLRRRAQLLRLRPDLELVPLRGNVPTRLRRLEEEGGLDALVLACAGLVRLGLASRIDQRLAPELVLPAVAQGALALQARRGDPLAARVAKALGDPDCAARVAAERGFLAGLGGDCDVPLAALAEPAGAGRLRLRGLVISADGARLAASESVAPAEGARAAGERLAQAVLGAGGAEILAALRAEAAS
jgi:hydroxymethylbilane synthase